MCCKQNFDYYSVFFRFQVAVGLQRYYGHTVIYHLC